MSIEQLRALGLTPLELLTVAALLGLIAWIKSREASRDVLRQAWHDETRGQLAETRATVKELETRVVGTEAKAAVCEQDRAELHRKVDGLRESVRRFQACPSQECPMRK